MMEEAAAAPMPFGIGRITRRWLVFMAVTAFAALFGLYAFLVQLSEGLIVTGLRDLGTMGGAPWGLYISFDIYFVGISFAGITMAAMIRLLDLMHLRPVARMAEVLTVVALILAAFVVLPDLGRPFVGIVNLFIFARPQSPFFGTFVLVIAGYLLASLVYLYLDSRKDAAILAKRPGRLQRLHRFVATGYGDTPAERQRHRRVSFWLAVAIIPILVAAHSTLGWVFGLQAGRPGWFGALQAPAFVVLAGISGLGALIVLAAAVRWSLREEDSIKGEVFKSLGKYMMILIAVYLYFMLAEILTTAYQGQEAGLVQALLFGEYAWIYWLSVALLLIPLVAIAGMALTGKWSVPVLVVTGLMVNLGAIAKRFIVVAPSLTHGNLLPYGIGSYTPTWVEYSIIVGLFGLGAFLIGLYMKLFPILQMPKGGDTAHA
ncbi:MAG: NrfD/PsrC family molybdoenzyme membrane anchor subunit [Thermoplasmata archaeon]